MQSIAKAAGVLMFLTVIISSAGNWSLNAAETLIWSTNENRVTADISSIPLVRLLEGVSQATGWQVYLESNADRSVSAKFKELPTGQALRLLLGNLNFALVPQTNARPRLYVFRSSQHNATVLVSPRGLNNDNPPPTNAVPNELLVTLKPGASIANLPCLQAATIRGRVNSLDSGRVTYQLVFESETSAKVARECLRDNPDVESIESNLAIESPKPGEQLTANVAADIELNLKDPDGDCKVIIGLIDTRVGSLGQNLDKFLMPGISIAGDSQNTAGLGHGPAMAETILRSLQTTTKGNTSVKILPVDVYGNRGTTTTFDVAQGIYRAVNSGANIINLSLGSSGDSPFLHNLIKSAAEKGVVFFGAAGNEPVTTPVFPAAYPEVIAVTAGDRNGQIASYANRGDFVDIMTPGMSVIPYNGQSYLVNGTSAAAAYASGLAAGLADTSKNCPPSVISAMKSKLGFSPVSSE